MNKERFNMMVIVIIVIATIGVVSYLVYDKLLSKTSGEKEITCIFTMPYNEELGVHGTNELRVKFQKNWIANDSINMISVLKFDNDKNYHTYKAELSDGTQYGKVEFDDLNWIAKQIIISEKGNNTNDIASEHIIKELIEMGSYNKIKESYEKEGYICD